MRDEHVYKVLRASEWQDAQTRGFISGSADDLRDGFIHLSTQGQLAGTLERHFAGETGLVVLEIAAARVNAALKWEPSRHGALFPHLHGVLPLDAVVRTISIPPPDTADRNEIKGEAS